MADLIPPRVDFTPASSFSNDVRVLRSMVFAEIKGDTQEEQLESFYITQSDLYDSYRYRMLHGRFPMICAMPAPKV
jgi:S-adenosylmethionine-diacylgycerolhomoserine-N-methlytransferase